MAETPHVPISVLAADFFNPSLATPELQDSFVQKLWPVSTDRLQVDLAAYFQYVLREQELTTPQEHAIRTYEDIILIVDKVRNSPDIPLKEIIQELVDDHDFFRVFPPCLSRSIELAIRLWLMLNIRIIITLDHWQNPTVIPWTDTQSLSSMLHKYLQSHHDPLAHDDDDVELVEVPDSVNVVDLKRIGGFRIKWTSHLNSHLRLRKTTIHMFHNISVLKRMRASEHFPIPRAYIDEAIGTISLLIPITSPKCVTWLAEEISQGKVDKTLKFRLPPVYARHKYPYWRESLSDIAETYGRVKPRTFLQWFYDRRDTERWWGFRLIVTGLCLTVLFGLMQSITGIIQVVRSG